MAGASVRPTTPSITTDRPNGRATIRDIAASAGVSITTVSRVLNDRPDVASETRDAVLQVIRELNFTSNRAPRPAQSGRTGLVGVTIPEVLGDYFAQLITGFTEALYELDMQAVLCPTFHHQERELTLVNQLLERKIDGAILVLPDESTEELLHLKQKGFPFVVADRPHQRNSRLRRDRGSDERVPRGTVRGRHPARSGARDRRRVPHHPGTRGRGAAP
jgi:DNA-binding LacI/PurR family transcriptional regulator